MTIKISDLVFDSEGRQGIVLKFEQAPDDNWIMAQRDKRIRNMLRDKRKYKWLTILPLTGGAVLSPKPLTKKIRTATLKDYKMAYKNANYYGKKEVLIIIKKYFDR